MKTSVISLMAVLIMMLATTTVSAQEQGGESLPADTVNVDSSKSLKIDEIKVENDTLNAVENSLVEVDEDLSDSEYEADYSYPADTKKVKNKKKEREEDLRYFCRHEFSIWAGGGVSTFHTKPNFGKSKYGPGADLGLGYRFYIGRRWSVMTGAEIAMYNAKFVIEDLTDKISTTDPDGRSILYNLDMLRYTEKDRRYAVNIPLQFQFETLGGENGHKFYLALGGKAGYTLQMNYEVDDAIFFTSGEYLDYGQTLYDQRDLGYGDQEGRIKKQDINLKWAWIGTAETGMKWHFKNPKFSLYTGVYFDWGFNEIRKDDPTNRFLEYDSDRPTDLSLNSVLTSQYSYNGAEMSKFTDKLSTMSFGIKLRLGIHTCASGYRKSKAKKTEETKTQQAAPAQDPLKNYKDGYQDAVKNMSEKPESGVEESLKNIEDLMKQMLEKPANDNPHISGVAGTTQTKSYLSLISEPNEAGIGQEAYDILVGEVYFDLGKAIVKTNDYNILDEKVRVMNENPNLNLIVIGNTCDLGTSVNAALGLSRAKAVKEYMVKKGVDKKRITTTSQGEEAPVFPNTTEENRSKNRRCDFEVVVK
ncbi:OmpA family protein [Bacteroidales bacterium OttesenSCG-928-I21]|nr:OmpA family protein [Bacteroidales bacterium OttesenSCG-928-I21]